MKNNLHRTNKSCIFAKEKEQKIIVDKDLIIKGIEDYYCVTFMELKRGSSHSYPYNVAKGMLMRMLNKDGRIKIDDIAEIFKMTPRNVKYHLEKVRNELKKRGHLYNEYILIQAKIRKYDEQRQKTD